MKETRLSQAAAARVSERLGRQGGVSIDLNQRRGGGYQGTLGDHLSPGPSGWPAAIAHRVGPEAGRTRFRGAGR